MYTCEYHSQHCARKHVRKVYFSTNFRRTTGKWRTNCAGSYVKIVGETGKSFCGYGREQKFRRIRYPLSHEHPLGLIKKPTGDGLQRTVCEPHTNYTNIQNVRKCIRCFMITLISKNASKKKLLKIKFPTKNSMEAYLYLLQEWR